MSYFPYTASFEGNYLRGAIYYMVYTANMSLNSNFVVTASGNNAGYILTDILYANNPPGWYYNSDTLGNWIQVEIKDYSIDITSYAIKPKDGNGANMYSWDFLGSSDGISWTVLDSHSGTDLCACETKLFTSLSGRFRFFKFNILGCCGGFENKYGRLDTLEIFGTINPLVSSVPTITPTLNNQFFTPLICPDLIGYAHYVLFSIFSMSLLLILIS